MACWTDKKYKLTKSEGFDEYMKALGVGFVLRKMGNTLSPVVSMAMEGDEYVMNTVSTFKSTAIRFKLGEEFDEETIDGRKVKSVMTTEGDNKFIHEQKGEKPTTIIREFTETEMTATMTIGDVKCVRYYEHQA